MVLYTGIVDVMFFWWLKKIKMLKMGRNSIGTGFPKIVTVTSIKIQIKNCTPLSLSYFYILISDTL